MPIVRAILRTILDPAWLFLLPGLAILAAGVLIPAQDRLDEARWQRDRTQAMLAHAQERLERSRILADAIQRQDPTLARTLAASQLNLVPSSDPASPALVLASSRPATDILASLEPPMPELPPRNRNDSRLTRLLMNPSTRLWTMLVGVVLVAIGLFARFARPFEANNPA